MKARGDGWTWGFTPYPNTWNQWVCKMWIFLSLENKKELMQLHCCAPTLFIIPSNGVCCTRMIGICKFSVSIPEWWDSKICQSCMRSWQPMLSHTVLAKPAFYPACARRTNFFFAQSPYHIPVRGYGAEPHVYPLPFFPFWVFSIKKSLCYLSMIHKLFLNSKRGMGAVPPCLPIALDLALKNP